jgi:hypothetical protein
MSGTILCLLAFVSCFASGLKNWRASLSVLLIWGYFFGILKAHFVQSWGHFIFDAATVGFYTGILSRDRRIFGHPGNRKNLGWFFALFLWPVFMALIPIQHYLVQIVGLRGNIFWLPMLLVGGILDAPAKRILVLTFSVLNIIALCFAVAEYIVGVDYFVPENEVTQIVFNSNDIAGKHLRIPSIFANAHSYANAMSATIPWLLGAILDFNLKGLAKITANGLILAGLISALLGVFIAGPRSPIILVGFTGLIFILIGRINLGFVFVVLLSGLVVGFFVEQNERLQRFTELGDIEKIQERVSTSLNLGFVEILLDYPMGNGMGAGGTSLPFFIQQYLSQAVTMENEYSRVLLEQGLPGLIIFGIFIGWLLVTRPDLSIGERNTKYLVWSYFIASFSTAWIGIGLMTTVPTTAILFLGIGYYCANNYRWFPGNGLQFAPGSERNKPAGFVPAYQRGLVRV